MYVALAPINICRIYGRDIWPGLIGMHCGHLVSMLSWIFPWGEGSEWCGINISMQQIPGFGLDFAFRALKLSLVFNRMYGSQI